MFNPFIWFSAFLDLFPQMQFIEFVRWQPIATAYSEMTWRTEPSKALQFETVERVRKRTHE